MKLASERNTMILVCPPDSSDKGMCMHARDLLNLDCCSCVTLLIVKWEVELEEALHINMAAITQENPDISGCINCLNVCRRPAL